MSRKPQYISAWLDVVMQQQKPKDNPPRIHITRCFSAHYYYYYEHFCETALNILQTLEFAAIERFIACFYDVQWFRHKPPQRGISAKWCTIRAHNLVLLIPHLFFNSLLLIIVIVLYGTPLIALPSLHYVLHLASTTQHSTSHPGSQDGRECAPGQPV